jgi:uncharacterized protein (DUF924 family)
LGEAYERAARHRLDGWAEEPRERLALILLLDQVPRHLYREDARAYATDLKAQALAARFFERQDWMDFHSIEKYSAATPYLHAEDLARQQRVNPVMHACAAAIAHLHFMGRIADLYLETIRRFGRFPHRNVLRGIAGTAEEQRFLEEEWLPRRRRIAPEGAQENGPEGEQERVPKGAQETVPEGAPENGPEGAPGGTPAGARDPAKPN